MNGNETGGIVVIILGVVLAVGAVRGTWKQVFNDLLAGSAGAGGGPTNPNTHTQAPPPVGAANGGGVGGALRGAACAINPLACVGSGTVNPLNPFHWQVVGPQATPQVLTA